MLGLTLGGWINDIANWRTAFFMVGLPGLAIALLTWLTLPSLRPSRPAAGTHTPFFSTLRHLFGMRSFRYMAVASSFYACGSYAINVFAPAFLMRVHGLSSSEAGLRMGFVFGVGGLIGTLVGGLLGDALGRRNEAWRQTIPAIGQWASLPTALAAWLVPNPTASVVLLAISYMFGLFYFAPTFAAAQSLVRDEIRATTSAALLFCLTLVGSSVGPMVVGWLSDKLVPQVGHLSLRYAMCASAVTIVLSAIFFHLSARSLAQDLRAQGAS
jgi:predicted MFS family arabinose efflux permease